ncbi:hypothetical protein CKM354_001272600 [Cercospora kikuchii]|uniref:ATP-dependent helicase n=1 Tax=Cercospora kikuchii TaxID=84275 RepID=A0A9P3FMN5_9PEZI|nr:uncharacterized protein CKM354_001272600 [Cercospora kikuchii]GIZ49699.1 hypothetical protein CKM354_001272600 [Cercospora kikuchii]
MGRCKSCFGRSSKDHLCQVEEQSPPLVLPPGRRYALATVQSTQVKSADEATIVVEAGGFTPARWFLDHNRKPDVGDERPTKRLKTEHNVDDEDETNADLVPLYEVAIDLHFAESINTKSPSLAAIEEDVDFANDSSASVVPYGITTGYDGTKIRLASSKAGDSVLLVECEEISDDVLQLLRNIALPGQLRSSAAKTRQKTSPATVLTCTLTRSTGPLFTVLRLRATLNWRSSVSAFPSGAPVGAARVDPDYSVLLQAYPDDEREAFDHSRPFDPQDFYESVHVPDKDTSIDHETFDGLLDTQLYPFQQRAVSWMLQRESSASQPANASFYKPVVDMSGTRCWINHLQGIVTRELPRDESTLSGGILAEEMGLGKTVELLALVSANPRPRIPPSKVYDAPSGTNVLPSRSTLVVTPGSLTSQWKAELARHSPNLSVFQYEGVPTESKKAPSEEETLRLLCQDYDVVITTYNVLSKEVHFAEDPPDRNMRKARRYERKRSPLVQIQWWRICLDEAQLVESGVTSAARVACRLPRLHSWAISGTPLRKDVQDLLGLLIFLRYKPFSDDGKVWSHLLTNHRHLFRGIFNSIALRHTKAHIRDELRLPPQKRVVVTVPFSVVEQQNYTTLFNQMCEEAGLSNDGSPIAGEWDPNDQNTIETMRSWLLRLRQTCLHPQVGGKNRKALGRGKNPLRTVAEVLEVMIEQNETSLRTEERSLLASRLLRAHILGNNREDEHRAEKALEIYSSAATASEQMVFDARKKLANVKDADGDLAAIDSDNDSLSESTPQLGWLRNSLRTALQLQHQCLFFAATAYYQIKTNETLTEEGSEAFKQLEAQEVSFYESAKVIRKEILKGVHHKAEDHMRRVKELDSKPSPLTKIRDLKSFGGIESRRIVEKSDELFDVIRESVDIIKEWRAKIAEYLLKPLVDEDDGLETTGDEYEDSTKLQDELYVYIDAFKAIHADLNTFIAGETAPLIDYEVKTNLKKARWILNPETDPETHDRGIHAPELLVKLFERRQRIRERQKEVSSVRALIQEARALESSIEWNNTGRSVAELSIVKQHIADLQAVHSAYTKALAALDKDNELFRMTQNQRLEFYRQLQELSDDVSPYKDELDDALDQQALGAAMFREDEASATVAQLKTKTRFLLTLRDDNAGQSGPRTCIICTSTFEQGVLTVCGHQFCKECLSHWLAQRRNCPMCKRNLTNNDIHNITFKPREIRAQEELHASDSMQQSPGTNTGAVSSSIYSDVDSALLEEVKSIDLPVSYGSKIDTLGRHLHWIREHDPGAKSIVFSQYRDFLDVLGTALHDFKIGCARLGRKGAVEKFRTDASVDCLLLDAKTDSSGLTLVNATHVFICEPLIQTAVELQAIARVHRIGQTRATTVWMYLINDTVEEAIYEISVARRLAHVQSRQQRSRREEKSRSTTPGPQLAEHAIDAANSDELQSAPLSKLLVAGKSGGELVKNDDLWQCLFGKASSTQRNALAGQTVDKHLRATAAEERAEISG